MPNGARRSRFPFRAIALLLLGFSVGRMVGRYEARPLVPAPTPSPSASSTPSASPTGERRLTRALVIGLAHAPPPEPERRLPATVKASASGLPEG